MPENMPFFPVLKDFTFPCKLRLIHTGNRLLEEIIFYGTVVLGQETLPSFLNLPFFHTDLQLHSACLLLFFKIQNL